MKWTDTLDIAIALSEKHPDQDPAKIRFTDLYKWVMELDGFAHDLHAWLVTGARVGAQATPAAPSRSPLQAASEGAR